MTRLPNYPGITMEIDRGSMNNRDYVYHMEKNGFYSGELEIGIASDIYNNKF